MQRNIAETVLGFVVLVVAAGFLFFFQRNVGAQGGDGYALTALFNKIDGLQVGSPVRVSGVDVGKVTAFRLNPDNYQAEVVIDVRNDVKLPRDTAAVIASAGLLDGKFMTLEPGADEEFLEAGGRIEYTQSTPSLEQLLGQVIFSLTSDKEKQAPAAPAGAPAAATPILPEMP